MRPHARLSPTLWRTCRALANRRRLRLLQFLLDTPPRTVSQTAREMGWPPPVTTQYLRLLNARGLLEATRRGRQVLYCAKADPTVPHAGPLLRGLTRAFGAQTEPVDEIFFALTAFTHPRRIAIAQALGQKTLPLSEIVRRTGISVPAARRHLKKLRRRGYVCKLGRGYRCMPTTAPLKSVLLKLAQES